MTLQTIPDVDHIIGNHLAIHPDLVAIVGVRRIVNKTPRSTDAAWIRLTMFDARSVDDHRSERLIEAYFQLDCYASKAGYQGSQQADAARLALAARAVLVDLPNQDVDDAVVTGVRIAGHARIPDYDFEGARERYVLTANVWMHA